MSQRVFVTTILPEPLAAKHKLSFAANNFSFNLISGGGFDKVFSILPLYTSGKMEKEAFENQCFELIYDKLRIRGGIWLKFAALKEQFTIFKKIPKGASVWFYNLNTLNALLFVLLKVFKHSTQLNVIVLDYTPVITGFGLNSIYLRLINMAHGRICLANSPLYKQDNSVTLPGVVPATDEVFPLVEKPLPKFLLSGLLSEVIAQTSMVLEAFSKMPEYELHISGSKNMRIVKNYADMFPNIVYHEQMKYADYIELLHSITYQLSTRDASFPENRCNFPSKIIEALLHNRAVVSTIHYPQIDGIKYFIVSSNVDEFMNDIRRIVSLERSMMMPFVNQGDKVKKMFSAEVWNTAMTQIEFAIDTRMF